MKLRTITAAAGAAAAMTMLAVSPASAAHCSDDAGSPGNSNFNGNSAFAAHVQVHDTNEGAHQGWATCEEGALNSNGKPFRG